MTPNEIKLAVATWLDAYPAFKDEFGKLNTLEGCRALLDAETSANGKRRGYVVERIHRRFITLMRKHDRAIWMQKCKPGRAAR